MYGNYAHVDEQEDDSVSGSFNLASLVDSNKKFKRRMGRSDGANTKAFKPVRIGQSVTKAAAQPRRFLAPTQASCGGSMDFERKMSDILEENVEKATKDVSLSEVFLDSLQLNTPVHKMSKHVSARESLVKEEAEKVSPDSGSFTMTQPETRRSRDEPDFTGNISGRDRPAKNAHGLSAPVRMNFTGPVRIPHRTEAMVNTAIEDEEEKNKENVFHREGGAKPKVQVLTNPESRIRERLQQLSGPSINTDPVNQRQATQSNLPDKTVSNMIPNHMHTPQPLRIPAPAQRPQPSMPPPSMVTAHQPNQEHVFVVKGKRYRVMKLLGKGGSSRVYEAFDEAKNTVVAIKRVDLSDADEVQTTGYLNEINMLMKLQAEDRIVRLYDHEKVDSEDLLYVIMEKGDTDLATLLKKYSNRREITPAMIKHYWTEMLHAVSVIHKRGIIHKDLKPANFLLVAGTLKLIDFGIASSVQSDKTSVFIDNQMGTFNFMSPESIQDLNGPQYDTMGNKKPCIKISFKSDVWSLGCILYQLTYGKMPFGDIKHPLMKLQAITNVDHPIQFPTQVDSDPVLVSVIKACLVRDPRQRASIEELLNHAYVTGVAQVQEEEKKLLDPVSAVKMLAALEGVLSPSTFKKTSEGLRQVAMRKTDGAV